MNDLIFYHGKGGCFWPDPPQVEAMVSKILIGRGFQSRQSCTFASRDKAQALDYAQNDQKKLYTVDLEKGAIISWMPGVNDFILNFEMWLKDRYTYRQTYFRGRCRNALLQDTQGDLGILNTYLDLNRQKNAVKDMLEDYLDQKDPIQQWIVGEDLNPNLCHHFGEVWITGPRKLAEIQVSEERA